VKKSCEIKGGGQEMATMMLMSNILIMACIITVPDLEISEGISLLKAKTIKRSQKF